MPLYKEPEHLVGCLDWDAAGHYMQCGLLDVTKHFYLILQGKCGCTPSPTRHPAIISSYMPLKWVVLQILQIPCDSRDEIEQKIGL